MRTILVLLVSTAGLAAAEPPVKVTVEELLATPEKFANRRVDVTAYYKTGNEMSALYRDQRGGSRDLEDSVWVDVTVWDPRYHPRRPRHIAKSKDVENRVVRVVGTFHYQPVPYLGKSVPYEQRFQGFGAYRLWKRAILDLTYMRPASVTHRKRPNQAMQLTASKPAIYAWSVCRRKRILQLMHRGLAAADLLAR